MTDHTSSITEVLPHRERFPHTRLSAFTRRWFQSLSSVISWVWVILIGVVMVNVTMRYLFGEGRIEFEEIQWHLFSAGFLLGLSACMDTDNHVRVDLLHSHMSLHRQAWIEVYGLLLLFFPFVIALLIFSIPFVAYSFSIGEVSDAPGGLPYRWVIKSILPLSLCLMLFAAVSRMSRALSYLFGWPNRVN